MKHLLDEELVKLSLEKSAKSQDAFSELVSRYEKQIFSLAYRLCGDYDEAADLAQEAFVRIYKVLDKYDTEKKFFSWMYRVAYNTCINTLNKRPKNTIPVENIGEVVGENEVDTTNNPENKYANLELKKQIEAAIDSLGDNYRDVVYLKYIEELSYQQIADTLNLPLSTVETRLFRGKKQLQAKLVEMLKK